MPSKKSILKAIAGAGALTAAGGGGYVAGHRTGMARDKETPYSGRHMQFAYQKGQVDLARRLRAAVAARRAGAEKKASMTPNERLITSEMQWHQKAYELDRRLKNATEKLEMEYKAKRQALEMEAEREFDRYSHDIGPGGRRGNALKSGVIGAGLGGALGGAFGGKGALAGAALGGVGLGGLSAIVHRRRSQRHKMRMAGEKKASVDNLVLYAFESELEAIASQG